MRGTDERICVALVLAASLVPAERQSRRKGHYVVNTIAKLMRINVLQLPCMGDCRTVEGMLGSNSTRIALISPHDILPLSAKPLFKELWRCQCPHLYDSKARLLNATCSCGRYMRVDCSDTVLSVFRSKQHNKRGSEGAKTYSRLDHVTTR